MTTTELITPPLRAPSPPAPASPTFGEMLEATLPLIGLVPVAGPPAILVAGPWLLFGLMLAGPFAFLVVLVVVLVAAAALIGLLGAILAAPYLLGRRLIARGRSRDRHFDWGLGRMRVVRARPVLAISNTQEGTS